jgi:phosphate transport system protein
MQRALDEQMEKLRQMLTKMSALAELMISEAIHSLRDKEGEYVKQVMQREQEMNSMQIQVDELCLAMIARYQPAADDLRFIIGAIKTNGELERLGDQAVNIVEKVGRLHLTTEEPMYRLISKMSDICREMVRESLHSYIHKNPIKAREILRRDDAVDDLANEAIILLQNEVNKTPTEKLLLIAIVVKTLERIGDHATNIAENAIFVTEGKDVRHHAEDNR